MWHYWPFYRQIFNVYVFPFFFTMCDRNSGYMELWRFGGQFQCALFSFFFSHLIILLCRFMRNSKCYVGRWIFWWKIFVVTLLMQSTAGAVSSSCCWSWLRREKLFLFGYLMSATDDLFLDILFNSISSYMHFQSIYALIMIERLGSKAWNDFAFLFVFCYHFVKIAI